MKTLSSSLVVAGLLAVAPSARAADRPKAAAAKPHAEFVDDKDIKWGAAPPEFPKGGQLAVLHGDPSKSGPFVLRFKMPDGYTIRPHWHSRDEQLTVVSGTLVLRLGDTLDAPAHALDAGGFHFLPAKAHHSAQAKGDTVVQVNGNGPFDIHYLNPADNPNQETAGAAK